MYKSSHTIYSPDDEDCGDYCYLQRKAYEPRVGIAAKALRSSYGETAPDRQHAYRLTAAARMVADLMHLVTQTDAGNFDSDPGYFPIEDLLEKALRIFARETDPYGENERRSGPAPIAVIVGRYLAGDNVPLPTAPPLPGYPSYPPVDARQFGRVWCGLHCGCRHSLEFCTDACLTDPQRQNSAHPEPPYEDNYPGYVPGDVVPPSQEALQQLLGTSPPPAPREYHDGFPTWSAWADNRLAQLKIEESELARRMDAAAEYEACEKADQE